MSYPLPYEIIDETTSERFAYMRVEPAERHKRRTEALVVDLDRLDRKSIRMSDGETVPTDRETVRGVRRRIDQPQPDAASGRGLRPSRGRPVPTISRRAGTPLSELSM